MPISTAFQAVVTENGHKAELLIPQDSPHCLCDFFIGIEVISDFCVIIYWNRSDF